jgi:hypothetical protein
MNAKRKSAEESEKLLQRRCPRLGGPVTFHYCKNCSSEGQPCWKIIDCWWETFDVERYLKDTLPEEQLQSLIKTKPKPKVASLLEIAQKARQNKKF